MGMFLHLTLKRRVMSHFSRLNNKIIRLVLLISRLLLYYALYHHSCAPHRAVPRAFHHHFCPPRLVWSLLPSAPCIIIPAPRALHHHSCPQRLVSSLLSLAPWIISCPRRLASSLLSPSPCIITPVPRALHHHSCLPRLPSSLLSPAPCIITSAPRNYGCLILMLASASLWRTKKRFWNILFRSSISRILWHFVVTRREFNKTFTQSEIPMKC